MVIKINILYLKMRFLIFFKKVGGVYVNRLGVIIMSHGNLSKELLRSAEMISGPTNENQVIAITMSADEGLEGLDKRTERAIKQLENENEKIIILTDLVGGTPNNVALKYAIEKDNINVISGVNLIILLSLLTSFGMGDLDLEQILSDGKDGMVIF